MVNNFKYYLFLSHNATDKARVRELTERLLAVNSWVRFDEWVIRPGDIIGRVIEEGPEASRVLVAAMSRHALKSEWAALESVEFCFRDPAEEN